MVFRNFPGADFFFCPTPSGRKQRFSGGLAHFGPWAPPPGPQARAEKTNTQFPSAKDTFWREIRPPKKFLLKLPQLFCILCFGRPDPHEREIANYWFSVYFGVGQPLALEKIPGGKQKNTISRCQGHFWGRERAKTKPVLHGRPTLVRPAKLDKKLAKRPPPQWRAREVPTRPDSPRPLLLTLPWPRVHHVSQPFGATLGPNRD